MLNRNIKGYKELKSERSVFKQKALEMIDKILDDVDADNMEDHFEIRTGLETVHLMCNISDNTIGIIISINTKSDLVLIELTKEEIIKGMSIIDFKDASKKINQFIQQNSPAVAHENYSVCPEGVFNKLEQFYDNHILINGHKNILIQIIDELIVAESLKTDAVKEVIISTLKTKMHSRLIKIDELELHQISEEKELREYTFFWDLNLVEDLIEKINRQKDIINIMIQYKEDQLKISRMKNVNPIVAMEKLQSLLDNANSRFEEIENEIDNLYNKLMK